MLSQDANAGAAAITLIRLGQQVLDEPQNIGFVFITDIKRRL